MSDRNDPIAIYVDLLVHKTDAAALCRIEDEDYWLPWSQIEGELSPDSECGELFGACGEIEIPRWLAEEKGLY